MNLDEGPNVDELRRLKVHEWKSDEHGMRP